MPRPARAIWVPRAYARRRHRSWMLSMTMATAGWAVWWIVLLGRTLNPEWEPDVLLPGSVSSVFGVVGLGLALLTVRAQRSWLLFVLVPFFANVSLLLVPWLAARAWGEGG